MTTYILCLFRLILLDLQTSGHTREKVAKLDGVRSFCIRSYFTEITWKMTELIFLLRRLSTRSILHFGFWSIRSTLFQPFLLS